MIMLGDCDPALILLGSCDLAFRHRQRVPRGTASCHAGSLSSDYISFNHDYTVLPDGPSSSTPWFQDVVTQLDRTREGEGGFGHTYIQRA